MFKRTLQATLLAGTVAATFTLHAQMAQDPLLSRTAPVEPNIVFMFDDSASMPATAIYQYGGSAGVYGLTGPGNDVSSTAPDAYHDRSPDVNLIYYDPRTTYSRRINADGSFQAAGPTGSISSFNVYFYKPGSSNAYSVNSVTVNNRGSGYPSSGITASFPAPPPGGTQATATVQTTSSPNVAGVAVTNRGQGYSTATTATFSNPSAGGATATGTVQFATSTQLNTVSVVNRGIGYAAGTTATFSAPTGPGGTQATGTPVLSATNVVDGATIGSVGSGYAAGTTVTFAAPPAPGIRATGTPVVTPTMRVNNVTVSAGGTGYPAGVTASFASPTVGTTATATVNLALSQRMTDVDITNMGNNYTSVPTVTVAAPPAGGTQATVSVAIGFTLRIGTASIASGGCYGAGGPTITFSPPDLPGGVQATATVTRAGGGCRPLNSITITNAGTGYTAAPTYTITGQTTGASNKAVLNLPMINTTARSIISATITNPGAGYSGTPGITVSGGGGSGGALVATMDGLNKITGISVGSQGTGYTSTPALTLNGTGAGTGATFTVNMTAPTNSITGINITDPGSGYASAPAITFGSTGGGTGAVATATLLATNWITGFTITDRGAGYTGVPTITLGNTGGGTGATFNVTGQTTTGISGITITSGGSGYTSTPTITLANTGGGTGFSYNLTLGSTNVISGISITSSGSGYTTQPPLSLQGASPGTGFVHTVNYGSVVVPPVNGTWPGTPTAITGSSNYFTPSYTPDAGSPLALGATVLPYPNTASVATANYPKFRNRTDCIASATSCSWAEERQNYANWKTYHSTRLELAKTGIGLAFQPLNPTFRLGWATINTLANSSVLDKGVRKYDSTVQGEFLTWLYTRPGNVAGTPNRTALDKVGQYYRRGDGNGPWGPNPNGSTALTGGASDNSHATCRRSYAMLMTDGYYNDAAFTLGATNDYDTTTGVAITSPTAYTYTPIGPYSDTKEGTKITNQFADVAMKYWMTDLRTDLGNFVKPVSGDEAYWQHLNFYAIGLGLVGDLKANDPAVLAGLTGSASSLPPRTINWPTAPMAGNNPKTIDDMWHATINGRGKMLNAKTAAELNAAIAQMMSDIGGKEGTQAGVAVSTASLTQDTKKYTPSYIPISWNGNVTAYNLDATTANQTGVAWQVETEIATDPVTGKKSYSSIIPAHGTRNIFAGNGATSGTRSVPFKHADLVSAGLHTQMNGTVNPALIDYLRGDATNEDTSASASSSTAIYRERTTRLGDIVNSTPVFVKGSVDLLYDTLPTGTVGASTYRAFVGQKKARSEGVLFVGANDGMLHAFRDGSFNPTTGEQLTPGGIEVFAYVPNAILPTINQLADKTYVHRYYVDGPNTETDVYLPGAARWANVVLGSTGAGAGAPSSSGVSPRTAVFAIDATSLSSSVTSLNASSVLWEVSSKQAAFAELGYVLTDVESGTTLGGQWVAVFGNGYESKSCQARLFVVNVETGALIKEFNTGAGSCTSAATKNGLGGVRLVRNDKQQIIGAYAGDLQGKVWKFNMNNSSVGSWSVDLGGNPLFTAGTSQPITTPPTVLTLPMRGTTDPSTGFMVVVGTGKFFEVADITSTATQSMYGIWDPLPFGAATIPAGTSLTNKSLLIEQTFGAGQLAPDGNTYYGLSSNPVDYVGTTSPLVLPRRGWWFDLPKTGQRLVYPMALLARRFVLADTLSPSNVSLDPCANSGAGSSVIYLFDALNGGGPTEQVFDTNGDNNIDSFDLIVSGLDSSADGRDVALEVSKSALSEVYADVSAASGATFIKINCTLTGDCPPEPPGSGTGGVKSRQWRQLFLR